MPRPELDAVLAAADDELVLGWRDSEWTGVAPLLEEDVALSSIAQGEIGHAQALYELAAGELGTDADALAFDRPSAEYRCAPLVELRRLEWAHTIARRALYEAADAIRLERFAASPWPELAALARTIEREEAYHRLHAELWVERLLARPDGRARLEMAVAELWPCALGVLEPDERGGLAARAGLPFELPADAEPVERGAHTDDLAALHEEMTSVRRLAPAGEW